MCDETREREDVDVWRGRRVCEDVDVDVCRAPPFDAAAGSWSLSREVYISEGASSWEFGEVFGGG